MRYEERAKLVAARALIPAALLVASPVLLIAGAPIRRGYLRHVHREGAAPILDKEQGRISVHWFVVTSPLLGLLCRPTESLARLLSRRGRTAG
ncbi:hypothetical protein [Streptomyces stelliscabiei]|uniref:hypothetical protein n=1 Tax=Streptomyces stelliscabiei TaxID=146820 RepID=UPI00099BCB53|nr:hypothetical protein [Streptomyces stelliscabiei]MDX2516800.1 hypothetical protein [Streptomyces stelliscabiei]SOD66045.1 hypothetical protein SAMN06272781_0459 [Streptomyces sp. 1222.2]